MERETICTSPEATRACARDLAPLLGPGSVLALRGELGAGKTCFVQGLAEGLGVTGPVQSPTYTLIHEYRDGRLPLFHMDLYRVRSEQEALDLGLDEYLFGSGVCAIEWAERIASLLPPHAIEVRLELGEGPEERRIRIATPAAGSAGPC